ncbi:MAG: hypothetical protein Q8Q15_00500 [bacterium]|nr:hypothetical protein [bacterium]
MMKHILLIREVDRRVFEALKKGEKTIETRAATEKYRKIQKGDILCFVCGKDRSEKQVEEVTLFKSFGEMVKVINFKQIMPFINSIEEMRGVYDSFPGYTEKIRQFGLVAFILT